MPFQAHKNFATSAVATAPSPASSGLTLVVTAGQGTRFPAVPFTATVCPANTNPDPSNATLILVTAVSTDTFTFVRTQESTSNRSITVGDQIFDSISAAKLRAVEIAPDAPLAALKAGMAGNGVESGLAVTWITGMTLKVAAGVARISGTRWSIPDTTLDVTMNGLSLPRSSLTANATEGFLTAPTASNPLIVTTSLGAQVVKFNGETSDTVFNTTLGAADGAGVMSTGGNISQGFTIDAADANFDRIDLLLANNTGYLSVLNGTPATPAAVPSVPAGSVVLAQIAVGAGITVLSAALVTDARVLLGTLNTALAFTPDNTPTMKQWRRALSQIASRPADILWGPGDSINEGYFNTDDYHRHIHLTRLRLQQFYNPPGIAGGEGYIPFLHYKGGLATSAGTPTGCTNLPQRWITVGVSLPQTFLGLGLGGRGGVLAAATQVAILGFYGDRIWTLYSSGPAGGYLGYAIDATYSTVATQGVLSGVGTGTFTITPILNLIVPRLPTAAFTLTVDDEDMTCTVDRAGTTITISARGANGTTPAIHIVGATCLWAPSGVIRVNTLSAATTSGRLIDSGALARDGHLLYVVPINRAASGYLAAIDGAMIFDGDGGQGPATFSDGVSNTTTTYTSASANFSTAVHKGQPIAGTDISPYTTIASVTNATTIVLSQAAVGSHSGNTFSVGGCGTGVRCWDGNRAASTAADYAGPLASITGYWAQALDNVDPDLCVIELGINDMVIASTPEPTFIANLTAVVNLIRAQAKSSPSIVLQVTYQPGRFTVAQWNAMVNGINSVALSLGCGVWDMTNKIPPSPATGGTDLFADYLHPTDLLSVDIAQQFAFYLGIPDPPATTNFRSFGVGGDGSDGSVIFDGAATLLSMVPAANVYTMTRDIYCRDITLNTGITLKTNNFRIFCCGSLTNTGTISNDGNAGGNAVVGTPGAAGTATPTGTLPATLAGGIGGVVGGAGAAGAAAVAADGPILGGNGGTGGTAGGAGGAGGATANTANINAARQVFALASGSAVSAASTGKILFIQGGQGGGGGGGQAATNAGGGAGASGGVVLIVCQTLINNGTISAKGGNGGTAPGTAAGGSGGGGGVIIILTTNPQRLLGTLAVEGGFPGLGGAGTPTAGARGTLIVQRI